PLAVVLGDCAPITAGISDWRNRVQPIYLRRKNSETLMSAMGHKRTLRRVFRMSALPPKADIDQRGRHVRFVP
ncbi:MAG: hypothetical protein WCD69_16125, partial [Xanthobacteraceae bacterium]